MELDLIQIARDLVRANTISSRGTAGAVAVLAPLYERLGWKVSQLRGPESTREVPQHNLLAVAPGPTSGDGFLAVTHLDTVDVGPRELWQTDPFELSIDGDRAVGLGSADVKIDAACKLIGFSRLQGTTLARPLAFLGTYMEEVGCRGAREFASTLPFPARRVACGEPSELRIIDAHKGYAVVRVNISDRAPVKLAGPFRVVQVQGKAAHSSTPHLGKNAILEGWPQMKAVGHVDAGTVANKVPASLRALVADPAGSERADAFELDGALELARKLWDDWQTAAVQSSPGPNARFNPPDCVVNWGALRSHRANVEVVFDARLVPGQSPSAFLQPFQAVAASRGSERYAIEISVERSNDAMQLAKPSALLEAAQATSTLLKLNPEPQAKPTNTEAGIFASAGCEAIVFGPGISTGNAHTANEHQLISQCRVAIDYYEALARKLCAQA